MHLEAECRRQGIHLRKPTDMDMVIRLIRDFAKEKGIGEEAIFEEIEKEIFEKERFIEQQRDKIAQMHSNYETLWEYL